MVLLLTSTTIVPAPSSTILIAAAGLLGTLVDRLLLAIVPRSETDGLTVVSATLMAVEARTVVVTLLTVNVPWPAPDADMLTADWPAFPLVKSLPVLITASNAALPPASTWMLSET